MERWEQIRAGLLKGFYRKYMKGHRDWFESNGDCEDYTAADFARECDYLCEKGWLRNRGSGYQLTAAGRDYVELHLFNQKKANILKFPDSRG